jgi:hypothetical protein
MGGRENDWFGGCNDMQIALFMLPKYVVAVALSLRHREKFAARNSENQRMDCEMSAPTYLPTGSTSNIYRAISIDRCQECQLLERCCVGRFSHDHLTFECAHLSATNGAEVGGDIQSPPTGPTLLQAPPIVRWNFSSAVNGLS